MSDHLRFPFTRGLGPDTSVSRIKYAVMYPGEGVPTNMFRPTDGYCGTGVAGLGSCGCSSCAAHDAGVLSGLGGLFGYNAYALTPGIGDLGDSMMFVRGLLSIAGLGLGAYHGYRRNNSVGWAFGWGALGALFPIVTLAVAAGQGFAKRKGR